MAITFHCPCGQTLQIPEDHAGQKAKCPACSQALDVPVYALVFAESNGATPMPALPLTPTSDASPAATEPSQSGLWNQITGLPVAPSAPSGTPGKPYYHLYSPKAVAGAALAGSVLAGAIVLTYNYQLLGQKKPAMIALAGGVVGTVVCFLLLLLLPALLAIPLMLLLSGLVSLGVANLVQGELFRAHREKGGEEASVQSAAGLGLLCSALFVVVWFVGYFPFSGHVRTPSVTFGAHGVYYTDGATAEDAERVGRLMEELGHFDSGEQYRGSKYVWVSRDGPAYVVSFLLRDGLWENAKVIAKCRDVRKRLAEQVFPGQPVEVWMCDGFRNPKVKLKE